MIWETLANEERLRKAVAALEGKGMEVVIAENKADAMNKLLSSIPEGSTVLTTTSITLEQIGADKAIDEGVKYISVKKRLAEISDGNERLKARRLASVVQYVAGSVHAVTEDGRLVIASASGSQLAPYAYTAERVVFVVGTQKIVKDLDAAFRRIEEYTVPLENERMMKRYSVGTSLNKILIINKELQGRIKIIFVKERLGF